MHIFEDNFFVFIPYSQVLVFFVQMFTFCSINIVKSVYFILHSGGMWDKKNKSGSKVHYKFDIPFSPEDSILEIHWNQNKKKQLVSMTLSLISIG